MAATIRHIAIFSEDPTALAKFYGEVFGMKVTGVDDLGNAWVTDGYMDVALLRRRFEKAPKVGINHWGFTSGGRSGYGAHSDRRPDRRRN